jgi:hypothetical protein
MTSNNLDKTESAAVEDKRDDLVHEAEEAIHRVSLSMLSDPALRS